MRARPPRASRPPGPPRGSPCRRRDLRPLRAQQCGHLRGGAAGAPGVAAEVRGPGRAAAPPFLVAEERGEVAGYAYAAPWRPKPAYRHTVEDTLYLAPGRTGRGLGSRLLSALLPASAEAGARQMIAVIAD